MEDAGKFDARYRAFLETMSQLRPQLHRYCSRMTGSITDGEDVVQDALFRAYRSLDTYDDSRPLAPWIFRIAHNQCIDFLRHRGVRVEAETAAAEPDFVAPHELSGARVGPAIEHLVLNLPPKERACVLLKDVFEYSLEEIAELVDSTVGGVKAATQPGPIETGVCERTIRSAARADTRESRDPSPVRRTVQSPGLGWTPRTDQCRRPIARCRSIRRQLRGWRLPRCLFTHARDVAAGTGRGRR